jgi:hypothetical protein
MDTLPTNIFYGLLNQEAAIRAYLGRAMPGQTGYFAQIDAALMYCMPHFVLPKLTGEDLAMIQHSKAHQAVFGLILFTLEGAELQNAYSRLVDYLHARPASFEDVDWLKYLPGSLAAFFLFLIGTLFLLLSGLVWSTIGAALQVAGWGIFGSLTGLYSGLMVEKANQNESRP